MFRDYKKQDLLKNVTGNPRNCWSIFSIQAHIGGVTSCTLVQAQWRTTTAKWMDTKHLWLRWLIKLTLQEVTVTCVRELIHIPNRQTSTTKQHAKVFDLLVLLYCDYSRIELFQTPQPWAMLGRNFI